VWPGAVACSWSRAPAPPACSEPWHSEAGVQRPQPAQACMQVHVHG
jgi:hypothetical protein